MPAISLEKLHQQIAQRERELERLRQELASRRSQFTALTRRKEELQSQLRQVESEIAALTAAPPMPTEKAKTSAPPPPPPGTPDKARPPMSEMILAALRDASKAMTARQLSEELSRRGFPLTGRNPPKSVESRLQEMKKKRIVRRAPGGQPGYVLVASTSSGNAEKSKTASPKPAPKEEHKAVTKPSKPAASGRQVKQPSLRQALVDVLKNSRMPLSGSELAARVLASGYKSNSAKFTETVWSMLGQMDNVEHLKGKGYLLKRK